MDCVFYWIFGILIALNVGNFLFALFKKKIMSIGSQGGWAYYLLFKLTVDAIFFVGYFVSTNPFNRFELFFWLGLVIVSQILALLSIRIFRKKFTNKLMSGVYYFKVNYICYKPDRIFGEFDTDFCKYPLSAELEVRNFEKYQKGNVFPVVVKSCYYDVWEWFYGEEVDITVTSYS